MDNLKMKISSGIKRIAIENENDEVVAVLKIDVTDGSIIDRFVTLLDRAKEIEAEYRKDIEGVDTTETTSIDDYKKVSTASNKSVLALVEETEKLFGKGLFKDMYAENYKLNPDYVPSPAALTNFYEEIQPVVEMIMKEHYEKQSQKYSVANKGKKRK